MREQGKVAMNEPFLANSEHPGFGAHVSEICTVEALTQLDDGLDICKARSD